MSSGRTSVGQSIAVGSLGLALGIGAIYVWSRPATVEPEDRVAIIIDASSSSTPERRCADIQRIGAQILAQATGNVRVVVASSGDHTTSNEPIRAGVVVYERAPDLLEQDTTAGPRLAFLKQLDGLCRAVPERTESPIFTAVSSVVRGFSEEECSAPNRRCRLFVRTDGLETADEQILDALRRPRHPRKEVVRGSRVDNRLTDAVVFCGLSERSFKRGAVHQPSIREVEAAFRREFSHPERVSFLATCAPFTEEQRASSAGSAVQEGGVHD